MKKGEQGISRRDFLKGVAGGAVTIGLLGATAGTAGSALTGPFTAHAEGAGSAPTGSSTAHAEGESENILAQYEVYDTDLLIIGCGYGGLAAAYQAASQGVQTIVLDKGPFGAGGATGMNFDFLVANAIDTTPYVTGGSGTHKNLSVKFNMMKEDDTYMHLMTIAANHGEGMVARNEDGTLRAHVDMSEYGLRMCEQNFPRHDLDTLRAKPTVQISDRTMVTDLIVKDGVCYGAMGYHLPTGTFRVYRAKATIAATGGCCWMNGWNTVAPKSGNVPDNTADIDMAAFRHGAYITDAEFSDYDLLSSYPTGIACGYPAGLGADGMNIAYMYDSEGVAFMTDPQYDPTVFLTDRTQLNRVIGETILAGKGSEHGGIYVDFSDPEMQNEIRYFYRRNITLLQEVFGIDVTQDMVECTVEMLEHGGMFAVDDNAMCEGISGLFHTRGGGTLGTQGDPGASGNLMMGNYAAKKAIEYAQENAYPEGFDWTLVNDEYERIHEIRTREAEDGLTVVDIRRAIQKIGGNCLDVIRKTEDLEAGLEELKRIEREDLPRQVLRSDSCIYNTEWKEAIENYNLLTITRLSVEATLLREESRGSYFRPDFPDVDDDNWNVLLYWKKDGDDVTYEKREATTVDWSSYDWSTKQ